MIYDLSHDDVKGDFSDIKIYKVTKLEFIEHNGPFLTNIQEPVRPRDQRAISLEKYLQKQNSYLAQYADLIIELSDFYNIDYKIVVAIAGVESGFCRINFKPYNCWGFGDYAWNSPETSIKEYFRLLHKNYYQKGLDTLEEIASIYNPYPEQYIQKVSHFINQIP
ncbi:MAG: hypothetical protein KatS3mg083_446 [Candidatus Dojkabacteria bacterium]|nr:MAG: hypothetical protein KatS3mg083_446 [Candidatus Dojkabacteria bacterium]